MNDAVHVPVNTLSEEALVGVTEAFVLREGTDYGHRDFSFEEKRAYVLKMLRDGEARIVYYPDDDFVDVELTT